MSENDAVADAGPLIHLDQLGGLAAPNVFRRVLVPLPVAAEVRYPDHVPQGLPRPCREEPARPMPRVVRMPFRLSKADIAVLSLALDADVPLVLTDDLEVRKAAVDLELRPVGTPGIIILAARRGRTSHDHAEAMLANLKERSTLYVADGILAQARRALASLRE